MTNGLFGAALGISICLISLKELFRKIFNTFVSYSLNCVFKPFWLHITLNEVFFDGMQAKREKYKLYYNTYLMRHLD